MVCYGPSRGCRNCRTRKIKCDEGRPTCGQCAKSKKICLGYDRTAGVAFRDETRSTEKRASKGDRRRSATGESTGSSSASTSKASVKQEKALVATSAEPSQFESWSLPSSSSSSSSSSAFVKPEDFEFIDFSEASVFTTPAWGSPTYNSNHPHSLIPRRESLTDVDPIPAGLPQDPEQQALCFFMGKFALSNRKEEIWGGSLEALPAIHQEAGAQSALSLAAAATSLSSIAWNPECAHFKPISLQKYVQSLKMINDAVQDPVESKSDGSLMAVLMLGFYENIKSLTLQKSARESHTKGAVALVKARSPSSFHNPTSLRLFLATRAQLLSHCIDIADPRPIDDFLAATSDVVPLSYVPTCADRLVILAMDVPSLRYRELSLLAEHDAVIKQNEAQKLLDDAKRCEEVVAAWSHDLPTDFMYTRMPLTSRNKSRAQNSYPSNMDIYRDVTCASTWNTWRNTRIRLLQIIMKCATILSPLGSQTPSPEYTAALNMVQHLVDDICSSIPFHLGHHEKGISSPGFSDYPHPPGQAKWPENFAATGAVGGWLMMPQLAFASKVDGTPNSQRQWMLEYLTTFMRDPRDMHRGLIQSPPKTAEFPVAVTRAN